MQDVYSTAVFVNLYVKIDENKNFFSPLWMYATMTYMKQTLQNFAFWKI